MTTFRHVGVVVTDMDRSRKFYQDFFQLEIIKDLQESGTYIDEFLGIQNVDVNTVKMADTSGNIVELLKYEKPTATSKRRPINDVGCSHIAFTVDNLEKMVILMKEGGVEFVNAPRKSEDQKAKVAFCKDPDGCFIELVEEL